MGTAERPAGYGDAALPPISVRLPEVGVAQHPRKLPQVMPLAALGDFSSRGIRGRLGDRPVWVEYSLTGLYEPDPRLQGGRYFRKRMPAGDALGRIVFEDHYETVQYISTLDLAHDLDGLFDALPRFAAMNGTEPDSRVAFIGNTRSGTHAHYDLPDNVILVLTGEKQFILFPPHCTESLHPHSVMHRCSNFSTLSDAQICALGAARDDPGIMTLTAVAGEMVYIPSCWWHRVINRGFTVSVSHLWLVPEERRSPSYRRYADALARFAGES